MVGRKKTNGSGTKTPTDSENVVSENRELTKAENQELDQAEEDLLGDFYEKALLSLDKLYIKHPEHDLIIKLYWDVAANMCLWQDDCYDTIYDELIKSTFKNMKQNEFPSLDCWGSIMTDLSSVQLKQLAEHICKTLYGDPITEFQASTSQPQTKVNDDDPIIIGIMSKAMRDHASGYLIRSWLNVPRDKKLMTFIIFSLRNDEKDTYGYRKEIQDSVDEFIDVILLQDNPETELTDVQLAELIKSRKVDILIDLDGHTGGSRFDVLLLKPAPVIVNFLGQPGSTGSASHDYIVVDETIAPLPLSLDCFTEALAYVSKDRCYLFGSHLMDYQHLRYSKSITTAIGKFMVINGSSKIPDLDENDIDMIWKMCEASNSKESEDEDEEIRLEIQPRINIKNYTFHDGRCLQFHLRDQDLNTSKPKQLLSTEYVVTTRLKANLPDDKIVIGSFNTMQKTRKFVFIKWLEILEAVQDTVLWVVAYPEEGFQNMKDFVKNDPKYSHLYDRIIAAPYCSDHEAHLRRIGLTDFCVDTVPVGSHTTALDITVASRALVICLGQTWSGRVAASFLKALKVPSLITTTLDGFVQKGIEMAKNPNEIKRLQGRIEDNKINSNLWNGEAVAEDMYRLFKIMHERTLNGIKHTNILPLQTTNLNVSLIQFMGIMEKSSDPALFKGKFRGQDVAVKQVTRGSNRWKTLSSELHVHKELNHNGIVKLIASIANGDNKVYIITQFCQQSLQAVIGEVPISIQQIGRILYQLLLGLDYLHDKNVIHCNLSPLTCLFDLNGNMKISNFQYAVTSVLRVKIKKMAFPTFYRTTGPPEVMDQQYFSFSSDVYDMGNVLKYMVDGNDNVIDVSGQQFLMQDILPTMLADNSTARPTCQEILKDRKLQALSQCAEDTAFLPAHYSKDFLGTEKIAKIPEGLIDVDTDMEPAQDSDFMCFNYDCLSVINCQDEVKVNFGFFKDSVGIVQNFDDDGYPITKILISSMEAVVITAPATVLSKQI